LSISFPCIQALQEEYTTYANKEDSNPENRVVCKERLCFMDNPPHKGNGSFGEVF
jgi:hypothetical protein